MRTRRHILIFLAALAFVLADAGAQTATAGKGDLILGFVAASGTTGASQNYEVNLGSASQFTQTSTVALTLSTSNLAATYGAGWATRSDLSFAIVGAAGRTNQIGGAVNEYWATSVANVPGASTPIVRKSSGSTNGISAAIEAMYSGSVSAFSGQTSLVGFPNQIIVTATLGGSFTFQRGTGTTSFAGIGTTASANIAPTLFGASLGSAGIGSYADLYDVTTSSSGGGATLLGTFSIAGGVLTFVGAAPSVTTQPIAQTAIVGGNVTLTVAATGVGSLTYQWRKGGVALGVASATSPTLILNSVALADAGTYDVVVTGSVGSPATSSSVVVTVNPATAAMITSHPLSLTANVNTSATFSVVAVGSPAVTYQWSKNGNAIVGATGSVYTISSAQLTDAGSYTVRVSNSGGSVTSNAAVLSFPTVPSVSTPPVPLSASIGSSVTFTVGATGTPTPTYQWNKDGTPILGATNAFYTVSSVQSSDAGNYTVTITNSAGSVTNPNPAATLTINTAPLIATGPANQTVVAGSPATFTAVVTGTPAPSLQWNKGGQPIAGATNATLSFASAQAADSAGYSVTATNSLGTATSSVADLTVTPQSLPTIVTPPTDVAVNVGDPFTLTVVAAGVPAVTSYQWSKAGIAIVGATRSAITVPASQISDGGSYTVTATNIVGTSVASSAATVTINFLPKITTQPLSVVVGQGADITFTVVATSVPAATYQWKKNGVAIVGATADAFTIVGAKGTNAGDYTVELTNSVGVVTSNLAILSISPTIVFQPLSVTAFAGSSVSFLVFAAGPAPLSYQWFKNGTVVPGAINEHYDIAEAQLSDVGAYTVTVANPFGTATSTAADLSFAVAPVITAQPTGQTVLAGSNVTLTVAAKGIPTPTYQWFKNSTAIANATASSFVISGAQLSDAGGYSVVASNFAGNVASDIAPVVVNSPIAPVITLQPLAQTAPVGGKAIFAVSATATPAPTYQWSKNGVAIPGATTSVYNIGNAQMTDAGFYTATVSNSVSAASSSAAQFTVIAPVAPLITSQPVGQRVSLGSNVTFSVVATGIPAPTFQWSRNGVPIEGATNPTLTISRVQPSDGGAYTVVVSNSGGTSTSVPAVLTTSNMGTYFGTFGPGLGDWAMVVRPDDTAVFVAFFNARRSGVAVSFTVNSDGSFSASGSETRAPGSAQPATDIAARPFAAQTGGVFAIGGNIAAGVLTGRIPSSGENLASTSEPATGPATSVAGYYGASVVDAASGTVHVIVGPSGRAFVVAITPTVVDGGTGTSAVNGAIVATTPAGGQFTATPNSQNNTLSGTFSSTGGQNLTFAGLLDGNTAASRLLNLSTRGFIPENGNLTLGFVVKGVSSKRLLVRAVGSTLSAFPGISTPLADPKLEVSFVDGNARKVIGNDNWGGVMETAAGFAAVGAFPLPPASLDAAVQLALPTAPAFLNSTVRVSASGTAKSGIVLAEIYDVDSIEAPARLVNLSTLAFSGTGENVLTSGFVVAGNAPKRFLIRVIGPGLAQFTGQAGMLMDPQLRVFAAGQFAAVAASNDDWGGTAELKAAFVQAGAFPLPDNSRDAAVIVTLRAGAYTVTAGGAGNTTGQALIEIYDLEP